MSSLSDFPDIRSQREFDDSISRLDQMPCGQLRVRACELGIDDFASAQSRRLREEISSRMQWQFSRDLEQARVLRDGVREDERFRRVMASGSISEFRALVLECVSSLVSRVIVLEDDLQERQCRDWDGGSYM